MSDHLLPEYIYRAQVEEVIRKTNEAIAEALGLVERQEDGPLTMRHAIKEIDNCVGAMETEFSIIIGTLQNAEDITKKLQEQRDEAIRQRDFLLSLLKPVHRRKR